MLIGEFSRAAGLNVATVRFYVRSGLLQPGQGSAGGTRPYMGFAPRDLRTLAAIRTGQALGMSLVEIKLLVSERRAGGGDRLLRTLAEQRVKLEQRDTELSALMQFLDAKIRWLRAGRVGAIPALPMMDPGPTRPSARRSRRH